MVTCLLFGFKYKYEYNKLPGIVIDLYKAFKICKGINYQTNRPIHISIYTDVQDDESVKSITRAVREGSVSPAIINFISERLKDGTLKQYQSLEYLRGCIQEQVHEEDKILIYYTGHGECGDILLPQGERYKIEYLRDDLCIYSAKNVEIFAVLDCCHGTGMSLPYSYKIKSFERDIVYPTMDNMNFNLRNFICISSSQGLEESIVKEEGSVFTKVFYTYIRNKKRVKLKDLLLHLDLALREYPQTTTIHLSYPSNTEIWRWILGKPIYDCIYDLATHTCSYGYTKLLRDKEENLNYRSLLGTLTEEEYEELLINRQKDK